LHLYAPPTYLLRLNLPGRVVGEDVIGESLASSSCRSVAGSDDGVARLVVESGEINCIDDEEGEDDCNCAAAMKSTTGTTAVTSRVWTKDDLPLFQLRSREESRNFIPDPAQGRRGVLAGFGPPRSIAAADDAATATATSSSSGGG